MNRNQTDSAKALGVSPMRLSNYESGKREPDLSLLKRIVEVYGVSADWLLGIDDSSATPRVTAANGSAAAANGSTASVTTGSSAETARLLGIIESQQRVIETLTAGPRP